MSVRILRWKGGFGGDTVLRFILKSNPRFKTNVIYDSSNPVTSNGGTKPNLSHINYENLSCIDKIALDWSVVRTVDPEEFKNSINELNNSIDDYFLKSHYYLSDFFNDMTIDIVADHEALPFCLNAMLNKTKILEWNVNDTIKLIKDPLIRKQYVLYSMAQDYLQNSNLSANLLAVSDILLSWEHLSASLRKFNIVIDSNLQDTYNYWISKNTGYFPSRRYKDYVKNKNYYFDDESLTIAERYSLLALAKEKFKILN